MIQYIITFFIIYVLFTIFRENSQKNEIANTIAKRKKNLETCNETDFLKQINEFSISDFDKYLKTEGNRRGTNKYYIDIKWHEHVDYYTVTVTRKADNEIIYNMRWGGYDEDE
jgi:hypothetical protein